MSPKPVSLLLATGLIFCAFAQTLQTSAAGKPGEDKAQAHQSESPSPSEPVLPQDAVSDHTLTLNDGALITYTATAGSVTLTDPQGGKTAEIFYVSYTRSGTSPTYAASVLRPRGSDMVLTTPAGLLSM